MDPNDALLRLRQAALEHSLAASLVQPDRADRALLELKDAWQDLDDWLSAGGHLPEAWHSPPARLRAPLRLAVRS